MQLKEIAKQLITLTFNASSTDMSMLALSIVDLCMSIIRMLFWILSSCDIARARSSIFLRAADRFLPCL